MGRAPHLHPKAPRPKDGLAALAPAVQPKRAAKDGERQAEHVEGGEDSAAARKEAAREVGGDEEGEHDGPQERAGEEQQQRGVG